MGEHLVQAWTKTVRGAQGRVASAALAAIEGKFELLARFLADEDDDVSTTMFPFASSYLSVLKQLKPLSEKQKKNIQVIRGDRGLYISSWDCRSNDPMPSILISDLFSIPNNATNQ